MSSNAADVTVRKACYSCGELKPLASFYMHKGYADGHRGACKVCWKSMSKAWETANPNPERKRAARRKRYLNHPGKVRAAERKWKLAHPGRTNAIHRKWNKANSGKVNANTGRRKAAKIRAVPKWSETELIKIVYEKAGVMGFQVDHVVPLQSKVVSGLHVWGNLQLLSQSENAKKKNYHWPDMWEQPA